MLLKCITHEIRHHSNHHSDIKLPKLKIRKFAGDTTAWMKFPDLFESTSSRSSNLSDVEKFNHLLPELEKGTLHTNSGLPIANINYSKALEIL